MILLPSPHPISRIRLVSTGGGSRPNSTAITLRRSGCVSGYGWLGYGTTSYCEGRSSELSGVCEIPGTAPIIELFYSVGVKDVGPTWIQPASMRAFFHRCRGERRASATRSLPCKLLQNQENPQSPWTHLNHKFN